MRLGLRRPLKEYEKKEEATHSLLCRSEANVATYGDFAYAPSSPAMVRLFSHIYMYVSPQAHFLTSCQRSHRVHMRKLRESCRKANFLDCRNANVIVFLPSCINLVFNALIF